MKTKFKFNIGAFTLNTNTTIVRNDKGELVEATAVPVEIPAMDIEGEVEYSASEMLEFWNVVKTVSNEAPDVFKDFAVNLFRAYQVAESSIEAMKEDK